jgi:hypothetical protein
MTTDKKLTMPDILTPDGLFAQMGLIGKASGYDILAERVGKLKKENDRLKEALKPFADMNSEITEDKKRQGGILFNGYQSKPKKYKLSNGDIVLPNQLKVIQ